MSDSSPFDASTLIALAAMVVAVWTVYVQRKQVRLSVTPHLDLVYGTSETGPLALVLVSNGIGPARIRSFEVLIDKVTVTPNAMKGLWHSVFRKLDSIEPSDANEVLPGQFLALGERTVLLDLRYNMDSATDVRSAIELSSKFESALDKMMIRIVYESLYGKRFVCEWSKPYKIPRIGVKN